MDQPSPSDRLGDSGLAARMSPELLLCLEEVWKSIDLLPLTNVVRDHGAGAADVVVAVYKILTRHVESGEDKITRDVNQARYKRCLDLLLRLGEVSMTREGDWWHFRRTVKKDTWIGATTWRIYAHAKNEECAAQLGSFIIEKIMFVEGISLISFKLPVDAASVCTRADNCVLYFSTREAMLKALKVFGEFDAAIFAESLPRLVTRGGTGFGYGQEPAMISVDFERCLATGNTVGVGETLKLKQVRRQSFNKLRAELILLALITVKARSQSRRGGGGSFEGFVSKVLAYFGECGLDTLKTGLGRGPGPRVTIGANRKRDG